MVKKDRPRIVNKTELMQMLPQVYQTCFQSQLSGTQFLSLNSLGLAPGMKMFLTGVLLTKQKGFRPFNLAAYWKRKYRGTVANEGWYILTNLESLSAALKAYQARSGIEAMFKDCKTGGYNLEGCHACESRLTSLVLIIAIANHFNSHLARTLTGWSLRQA